MNYDEFNKFCASLTATSYIVQWGWRPRLESRWQSIRDRWVGKKLINPPLHLKPQRQTFIFLKDEPGFRPAPYMASRGMNWVQQFDSAEISRSELKSYLKNSHRLVALGLTKKKQKELGLLES